MRFFVRPRFVAEDENIREEWDYGYVTREPQSCGFASSKEEAMRLVRELSHLQDEIVILPPARSRESVQIVAVRRVGRYVGQHGQRYHRYAMVYGDGRVEIWGHPRETDPRAIRPNWGRLPLATVRRLVGRA